MIDSSKSIMCYFSMWVMLYYLSKLISLVKEGDMGCASLAAISKHVTESVIKHGGRLYSNVRFAKYLSIRLTARYSVSVL